LQHELSRELPGFLLDGVEILYYLVGV